jgi:hypothetical protein
MRRAVVAFSALSLIGVWLTGCGLSRFEQREPWRTQAEEACVSQKLVRSTAYMSAMSEIQGPGTCGMTRPFKVAAFSDGTVGLTSRQTLACPIIPQIDGWLNEVVQPAAATAFGASVVELKSGSYSCRSRNNQRGARLSEHSFGNALDVSAFRLSDGREITVAKGWRGSPEEQEFLREVFVGACQSFTTVLGPGADSFHHDHFHLDLARHDPRGERHICKPVIKFTPRFEAGLTAPPRERAAHSPPPFRPEPDLDIGEEDDPFEAGPVSSRGAASQSPIARAPEPPVRSSPPLAAYSRSVPAGPPPRPNASGPRTWTGQGIY